MKTREEELYLVRQTKLSLTNQTNQLLKQLPHFVTQQGVTPTDHFHGLEDSDKLMELLNKLENEQSLEAQLKKNEENRKNMVQLLERFTKLGQTLEIQDSYKKLEELTKLVRDRKTQDLRGMDEKTQTQVQATLDLLYLKLEEEYGSLVVLQSHEIVISKTKRLLEGKALFPQKFAQIKAKLTSMLIEILTRDELSLRIEDTEGRVKLIQYYSGFEEEPTEGPQSDYNQFQLFALKCEATIDFCFQVVEFELLNGLLPLIDEQLEAFLKALPSDEQRDSVVLLQNQNAIDLVLAHSNYMKSIIESFDILAAKKTLSYLRKVCISVEELDYSSFPHEYVCFQWVHRWIQELTPFLKSKSNAVILTWAMDIIELLLPPCASIVELRSYFIFANSCTVLASQLFQQSNKEQAISISKGNKTVRPLYE